MKRYRVEFSGDKPLITSSVQTVLEAVGRMLIAGTARIDISQEEAPDETSPVALHHIRKGCCDGTDPVACYAAQQEREVKERAEQMAKQRAERAKASSPKPWDEFEGTD